MQTVETKAQNAKIIKALIAARKEITEPRKLRHADTGKFKYSFADLDEVLDCVVGPCLTHGIVICQTPVYEGGHAGVKTTLMHESGEVLEYQPLMLPAPRLEPQGAGICIAYARRYALLSIFNLAQVDEDGAYNRFTGAKEGDDPAEPQATVNTPPQAQQQPAAAEELAPESWIKRLKGVVANSNIDESHVLKQFGITTFDGLTKADTVEINTWIASQMQPA